MFSKISRCRACSGSNLVKVLDLLVQPLANDFKPAGGECAGYAPLEVMFCRACTLAQLSVVVRPEVMYSNYPYVTSESSTMLDHFCHLMNDIDDAVEMKPKMNVLEIGSNTGFFLDVGKRRNWKVLGIEPARNLAAIANERGIKTIDRMWGEPSAIELGATGYRADVIVARHVFAHIADWKGFIHALEFVSHKDTLVVIEAPWVVDMFKMNSFDQVYHEHLSYVSITAIQKLIEGTHFYLDDVKHYPIHGGTIALFLKMRGPGDLIGGIDWQLEREDGLEEQWRGLQHNKVQMSHALHLEVQKRRNEWRKVCAFGASAKATVWINACGFTRKLISDVCDCTPQKQNCLIPGTDIPVVPESRLMEADYAICFSWNFFPEIRQKFKAFEEKGGRWILPCPDVRIVE